MPRVLHYLILQSEIVDVVPTTPQEYERLSLHRVCYLWARQVEIDRGGGNIHTMSRAELRPYGAPIRTALGALAGPLFVGAFTVIGARRSGYDWKRHAVSSLAAERNGWPQRLNFMLTGVMYVLAASGIARCPRTVAGSRLVPALVGAAGVGLIGSGVFVTDPVGGFPPPSTHGDASDNVKTEAPTRTRSGTLHNLFAIPIFVGVPLAGMLGAVSSVKRRRYWWATYSVGSSVLMVACFILFGAAFSESSNLAERGGIFQRLSVVMGFGWMSALSLRAYVSAQQG